MAIYIRKDRSEILRQALSKLEKQTPIKATSSGSVARAFTEAISTELGDLYDALDFGLAQTLISSATGRALDLLGEMYAIKRRTISTIVTVDKTVGSFYFYLDSPHIEPIEIPAGTSIYTSTDSFVGRQLSYKTTAPVTIAAGRTRAFASIAPNFSSSIYTAGVDTLNLHSFLSPPGVLVKCTNPKAISAQPGFEDDANYRVRIIKGIRVAAAGTLEAVRFSVLSVPGIRDVKIREEPYGLGSFEVIVTAETGTLTPTSFQEAVRQLNSVRPVGVRMFLRQPELVAMGVTASIVMSPEITPEVRVGSETRASIAVQRYLNSLLPGEPIIYNRLIQSIMSSSDGILDVQITSYAPNGVEALRRNFLPTEEQQIIPGNVSVSVAS